MAMSFSFNNIKRKYWRVDLKDNRSLTVRMPSKKVFDKMNNISELGNDQESVNTQIGELHDLCAAILSNNMEGITISKKEMEDYELEEMMAFIIGYKEFISSSVQKDPN